MTLVHIMIHVSEKLRVCTNWNNLCQSPLSVCCYYPSPDKVQAYIKQVQEDSNAILLAENLVQLCSDLLQCFYLLLHTFLLKRICLVFYMTLYFHSFHQ